MSGVQLQVADLRHSYRGNAKTIGPFSFVGKSGQTWAVIGSNGAGKSTFFKLIAGDLVPTSGSIAKESAVELVPQGMGIPGRLTVNDLFQYLAMLRGIPAALRETVVHRALASVDLREIGDVRVDRLSGGQYRRVVIGQALLGNPQILLLDEPTVGLDLEQRSKLRRNLKELGQDRLVMITSHVVEDLAGAVDHVLHIANGRQAFAGPVSQYLDILGESSRSEYSLQTWTKAYRLWNHNPNLRFE